MTSPAIRRALSVIGRPQHQKLAAKGSLAQYEQIIPICCLNNTVSGQPMEYSSEVQRGSGKDPFWAREPLEPPIQGLSPHSEPRNR